MPVTVIGFLTFSILQSIKTLIHILAAKSLFVEKSVIPISIASKEHLINKSPIINVSLFRNSLQFLLAMLPSTELLRQHLFYCTDLFDSVHVHEK